MYVQVKLDANGDVTEHLHTETNALQSPRYTAVWTVSQFETWLTEWRARPRLPQQYEWEAVEKQCEQYISDVFATNSGRMDLARRESTKWIKNPTKYTTPLAMWQAVINWQNTVFALYTNYRYGGVVPDFSTLPEKPYGYRQIIEAEAAADMV